MKLFSLCGLCVLTGLVIMYGQEPPAAGTIYGRVLGAAQEVVGGARVEVTAGPSAVGRAVTTRGQNSILYDGGFFIPGLLPGLYDLQVSHEKYVSQTRQSVKVIPGSGAFVLVELQPAENVTGSISGTVIVRDGSPKDLGVGCIAENEKKPEQVVKLGKEGIFSFKNLSPGRYHVVVMNDREEVYRSELVTVTKKKDTRHVVQLSAEVLLEKPGWITGRVLGPDQRPAAGVVISLVKMPEGQEKVSATSDAEGKFELKPLRPGNYELKAGKDGVGEDTVKTRVRSNAASRITFYLKKVSGK